MEELEQDARWLNWQRDFFGRSRDWICECGIRCDFTNPDWRWNGRDWEHSHGYPLGHVPAERKP